MTTLAFIVRLRELHDKAKRGALTAIDRPEYEQSRRELGRLLLVAQHLNHGGQTLRSQFRVARMIKVEIDLGGPAPEKTSTIDLASGGFAALLSGSQPIGKPVRFTMQLPQQAIEGTAKVASSRSQGSLHRVSFSFADLPPAHRDHLEMLIVDEVLSRFQNPV
jgi:hypothetical protein